MSDNCQSQARIMQLERIIQQQGERIAALEAARPYMATKADVIQSSPEPRFKFGGRKRKRAFETYWINNDVNFAVALIVVAVLALLLPPIVIGLAAAVFAGVF